MDTTCPHVIHYSLAVPSLFAIMPLLKLPQYFKCKKLFRSRLSAPPPKVSPHESSRVVDNAPSLNNPFSKVIRLYIRCLSSFPTPDSTQDNMRFVEDFKMCRYQTCHGHNQSKIIRYYHKHNGICLKYCLIMAYV